MAAVSMSSEPALAMAGSEPHNSTAGWRSLVASRHVIIPHHDDRWPGSPSRHKAGTRSHFLLPGNSGQSVISGPGSPQSLYRSVVIISSVLHLIVCCVQVQVSKPITVLSGLVRFTTICVQFTMQVKEQMYTYIIYEYLCCRQT